MAVTPDTRVFRPGFVVMLAVFVTVGALTGCSSTSVKQQKALEDKIAVLTERLSEHEERIEQLTGMVEAMSSEVRAHPHAKASGDSAANTSKVRHPPVQKLIPTGSDDDQFDDKIADNDLDTGSPLDGETVADSSQEVMHLYFKGLSQLQDRRYEEALKSLREFLKSAPDHVYADRAQFLISRAHFLNQDYALAVVATNLLESHYPYSFKLPDALLERADSFGRLGQEDEERATLSSLMKRFPASPASTTARQKLAKLDAPQAHAAAPLIDDENFN